MTSGVRRVHSGSPWEESFGCARAVAAGDRVVVGGTTAFRDGVLHGEGDPYEQAGAAFAAALDAIGEFGLGIGSVILTRVHLAHARDVDAVGRAHRELFGSVRPAATFLVVEGFVDSRILVSVELEAYAGGTAPPGAEGPARARQQR
ncbi:Rid family hydrolase [Streptomyces sp. SHP 1-2]|nr:Rid family hydrolase [Streptomyces sp. SHP 1-2]MCW5249341.1 RidA family protein [Streptomyces sp. SHP 1-2]